MEKLGILLYYLQKKMLRNLTVLSPHSFIFAFFRLRLTMSSTEVELTDEFHRMGITDMIASIGGSVVLFTGFSFLEFCVDMIEILVACCCSSKKKNPKNRVSNSADSRITVASAESDEF